MKKILQTNIYKGPEDEEEIITLTKELSRKGWPIKVYNTYRREIEATIYGIYYKHYFKNKKHSLKRILGKIELGRIETNNEDKNLESFLENYDPNQQMKGGEAR